MWWRFFYAGKGATDVIGGITNFIFANWRILIFIYATGAAITFAIISFFALWIFRKEWQQRDLYPDEYFYADDAGGPAGLATAFLFVLFTACVSAVLWPGIPLVILGVLFLEKVASRFPGLMGNLLDDQEENKGAEND